MTKNPNKAACGGIFRDFTGKFIGGFTQNLITNSPYVAKLIAAIMAIEIAYSNGWHNLWLETDSQLVLLAFKSKAMIPWDLRNRWINCIERIKLMNFFVNHIYREGNSCADDLANIGLTLSSYVWFPSLPVEISQDYNRNRL